MPTPFIIIENEILGADDFADILIGGNDSDGIAGQGGDDVINGGGGKDLLLGNAGNDSLDGGNNADVLFGGLGDDFLLGGGGADWLSGDQGSDVLRGGLGNDTFFFNANTAFVGSDIITDWAVGDVLVFGKYTGTNALQFNQDGANVQVSVDLGNDGTLDYLAVTVLNATVANILAVSGFEA